MSQYYYNQYAQQASAYAGTAATHPFVAGRWGRPARPGAGHAHGADRHHADARAGTAGPRPAPEPREVRTAQRGQTPLSAFAGRPEVAGAYATLWLQPGAPLSVVKAAYRALASHHHPDTGGDPAAMTRLNQAYALLKEHLERVA